MNNHIIVSSCLYGSYFLFNVSLALTNKALLEDKKIPKILYVMNGLTMLAFGSIVIYNFGLPNLFNFKSSRV
jgi:hypothetical protein